MRHGKALFMVMMILPAACFPQAAGGQETLLTGSRIGDILLADIGCFGGAFAGVGLNFLILGILGSDGDLSTGDQITGSVMTELSDIPLFLSGSPDALALSVGGAFLWGAEALADAGYGNYSRTANLLYWGKNDLTMYKAYDSYASLRLRSKAWNNSGFERRGFLELMAAPLNYRLYSRPQPWIALGAGIGLSALYALVFIPDPWAGAVWTTGEWYIDEIAVNPASFILNNLAYNSVSSVYTGVGEEAVFRGFLHEELSGYFGKEWAAAIDTTAFLIMHFFTDLARGMEWDDIGIHMLQVAAANLLLDWAYDEGGLPLSVTCHALWDFAAFVFNDLLTGGTVRQGTGH